MEAAQGRAEASAVDVVVVGCGPVGATAANLLGRFGVRTLVVERDPDVYPRARAVTVNDWTLRIYQSIGLDQALVADMEENGALTWQTYSGREVFKVDIPKSELGHPSSMMIYQPAMETTVRQALDQVADTVEVVFGEQVTDVSQDDHGATVTIESCATGERRTVRARYVLACDGGSSRLRTALGIEMTGETLETNWIVVDAQVLRWWPGCKALRFWADPRRPVVDIPLALGNHRWEFPLRDGERREDFDSDEAIWALLTPLGITRDQVRVKQHAFYVHHLRTAERWRVGRVFLLGDAAHLMPPWAGQGMQSGIRDAGNLAWKLREVLAGRLGEELLDTYQAERAPHVAAVTELSRKLGHVIASRDRRFVAARNTLGPLVKRVAPLVRALLPSTTPLVTTGWLTGPPGRRSPVGRMLPQPEVFTANGLKVRLDDVLGHGFAVLGLEVDPVAVMSSAERASWQALDARFVTIRQVTERATADTDLLDCTGELSRWLKRHQARVVAVRPDRFVAASDRGGLTPPTPVSPAGTAERSSPSPGTTMSVDSAASAEAPTAANA